MLLTRPIDLACFSTSYAEAAQRFRAAVAAAGSRAYANPNTGPKGEALATDVAWFGPADAAKVLVLLSATHGVEGFCGSGCQLDWLAIGGPGALPDGIAALVVHAINPYGFAWQRRVTEEGVDLNRNFVDFDAGTPENPGYAELADAFVPTEITGPAFEAAEARLQAWREKHGERAFQIARSGGQYSHADGMFFGGHGPTWSRRTLMRIIDDYELASRAQVFVLDYHTGLGPFGYGEPISGNEPGSPGHRRGRQWIGPSLTEPTLGTSSSVPKVGLSEFGWSWRLGDRHTYVALEYGTFTPDEGRRALREDHWLHRRNRVDWDDPEVIRIKAQIRRQYYPETDDWKQMVLFRSRQIIGQALAGLAAG